MLVHLPVCAVPAVVHRRAGRIHRQAVSSPRALGMRVRAHRAGWRPAEHRSRASPILLRLSCTSPPAGGGLDRTTTRVTRRLHALPEATRTGATLGDGAWRSLVAHLLWEQDVGGSNPLAPTIVGAPLGDTPILQGASNRWRGRASSGRPRMPCNPGPRRCANGFSNTSR